MKEIGVIMVIFRHLNSYCDFKVIKYNKKRDNPEMNFSDFLMTESESTYKTDISLEDALELIKTKCNDTNMKNPLVRGMRGTNDAYIFEGQKGNRRSITRTNFNTVILDEIIKELNPKYPLRSSSVICTTMEDIDSTERFGDNIYVIFPYDDTIIGYLTKSMDLNYTKFNANNKTHSNAMLRAYIHKLDIDDTSFPKIVKDIEKVLSPKYETDDDRALKFMVDVFGDDTKIEQKLRDIYDPSNIGYAFGNMKEVQSKLDGECWIGGKCIAIHYDVWKDQLK